MSDPYQTSGSVVFRTSATSEFYIHLPHAGGRADNEPAAQRPKVSELSQPAKYFSYKPLVDRAITAVLMLVALPLMGVIALAILICDGRPVFYRQVRVGKDRRLFRIWKFRTMCPNAETKSGAVWCSVGDPRVTRLGRWLRCSHLDELPQFFNVLAGQMNLIGPRPERPEFVRELAVKLPGYLQRLAVAPGITGLSQLRLGYDQSVSDVQNKVELDIQYINTTGLRKDLRILLETLPYIAGQLWHRWRTAKRKELQESVGPADTALPVLTPIAMTAAIDSEVNSPDKEAEEAEPIVLPFPSLTIGNGVPNAVG